MRTRARFAAILLIFALLTGLFIPAGAAGEQTIEEMFRGYNTGGSRSNLSLRLEGDTATFHYSPVFYVERNFPGYDPLTDEDVAEIIDMCVTDVKKWEGDYEIRGRTLTFAVKVAPSLTADKSKANVLVVPRVENSTDGSAQFNMIVWRPDYVTKITLRPSNPRISWFYEDLFAHEFGHAMGLSDAYSYANRYDSTTFFGRMQNLFWGLVQPEAPEELVPWDAIMRGNWSSTIYDRDVEMVLWAWKHGKMQLYADSIAKYFFFWELSPAFSQ